jgi:hypothetical protein
LWPQTDRPPDALPAAGGRACPPALAAGSARHRPGSRPRPPQLQPPGPRSVVGGGRDPVPHRGELAAPGRGHRPVVPAGRGLGHGPHRQRRARHRRPRHGLPPPPARSTSRTPLRPRRRLHLPGVPSGSSSSRSTSPSDPPATASTTPPSSRSSPPSNASSPGSTPPRPGPPEPPSAQRCSATSKASTTQNASNTDSANEAPSPTSKTRSHNNPCPRKRVNSNAVAGTQIRRICRPASRLRRPPGRPISGW